MLVHSLLALVPFLLFTTLTEAALPLPRPVVLPKPAPKPPIKRPSRLELVEYGQKGVEGLLSYYNPSTPTASTTRPTSTATAAPVRLTAGWATTVPSASPSTPIRLGARAPSPTTTTTTTTSSSKIPPSCPRAQLDLAYCAAWYPGALWTATNAAYCLCEGLPRASDAQKYGYEAVYVPELFEGDAAECVRGYEAEVEYYEEMVGKTEKGEVRDAYVEAHEEAEEMLRDWEEAVGFCGGHQPEGQEGREWVRVGREYFLGADGDRVLKRKRATRARMVV